MNHHDQNPLDSETSRRSVIVRGVAGIATGLLGAVALSAPSRAGAAQTATSGGLGLTQAEFEQKYGTGSPGQGANFYTIGSSTYAVTPSSPASGVEGIITSVFWKSKGLSGDKLTRVQARMKRFRPSDAKLMETFDAPGNGVLPTLLLELYNSAFLADAFAGTIYARSGNFVIAYGYSQNPAGETNPVWADIYVGTGRG